MMVVPASSAEGEWSFSTLRCLKTWLRTTQLNSLAICHVHQNKLDGQETNLWEPCWVKQGMHSGFWVIHLDDTFPCPPTAALSITAAPLHIFIPFLNLEFRAPNTLLYTCINNLGTKHQICNAINWKRKFCIAVSHASIDLQSWKFAHICLSSQGTTCCHFSCPPVITVAPILRTYDNRCQSTSCIFDSLLTLFKSMISFTRVFNVNAQMSLIRLIFCTSLWLHSHFQWLLFWEKSTKYKIYLKVLCTFFSEMDNFKYSISCCDNKIYIMCWVAYVA